MTNNEGIQQLMKDCDSLESNVKEEKITRIFHLNVNYLSLFVSLEVLSTPRERR